MDLDLLISKYSKDLMEMKSKWSQWGIEVEEKLEDVSESDNNTPKSANEENLPESSIDTEGENEDNAVISASLDIEEEPNVAQNVDSTQEVTVENAGDENEDESSNTNEAESKDTESEDEATSSVAGFSARVFTGEDAYPVENAKVLIYKDKKLFHFLLTDENGNTPRVEIAAAPSENALIPNSENQKIDYFAEVVADGFTPQKNLLVSAVGGTEILLPIQLIPISERND